MDGEIPRAERIRSTRTQNLRLDFLAAAEGLSSSTLFAHPGYRAVLGAFGPNLLFKTGSRPVKRQSEHDVATAATRARMRAIPNNAILQQFGYVANVVAGLGAAVGSRARPLHRAARKSSQRLQSLLSR